MLIVLLSILLPVGIICLLLIFFCWCCHHRNNRSHLSSYSSTSTPIKKKSSHLVNTVTSSPFRSTMITANGKLNQRQLPSSSSSSANTNFTNTYLRQTLLKSESKRPAMHVPSPGISFNEVPFMNIRFLQELGEGNRLTCLSQSNAHRGFIFRCRRVRTNLQGRARRYVE